MKTKKLVIDSGKVAGKERPEIILLGTWLDKVGFTPDTPALVEECDKGFLMIKVCGKDSDTYNHLSKDTDLHGLKLIQAKKTRIYKNTHTYIQLFGLWLEEWGFAIGDSIIAAYEDDRIYIKRI